MPSTTGLPSGWSIGFTTDNGKGLTVKSTAPMADSILYPKSQAAGVASLALAGNRFEFLMLQYDGAGNFRVLQAYAGDGAGNRNGRNRRDRSMAVSGSQRLCCQLDDNGAAVSSFNSPAGLYGGDTSAGRAITAGWTIAVASDNTNRPRSR